MLGDPQPVRRGQPPACSSDTTNARKPPKILGDICPTFLEPYSESREAWTKSPFRQYFWILGLNPRERAYRSRFPEEADLA